jgi:PAS domain S-box-containing protein
MGMKVSGIRALVFWRNTIRGRLYALLLGTALALGVGAAAGGYVFSQVRVNGTLYRSIILGKDLEADLVPPAQFIVEAYLNARELVRATEVGDSSAADRLSAELLAREELFNRRGALWRNQLADPVSRDLFEATSQTALDVFRLVRERLVPTARARNGAAARRILDDEVVPAFDAHRASTERLTVQIQKFNISLERTAERLVRRGNLAIIGVYGVVLLTVALTVFMVRRSVLTPLAAIVEYFDQISKGRYDLSIELSRGDEIGDVMRALDDMRRSRKAAQDALERSEERFALAMAGTRDGLWDWDLITNSCYYSPRWKQMLGYGADELGSDIDAFKQVLHPDEQEQVFASIGEYLSGKVNTFRMEIRLRHKDGHYLDIVARAHSVLGPDGHPIRVVGADTDVTTERAAERRLELQYAATTLFIDAGSLETVAPKLLNLVCAVMNWDVGCVRVVNLQSDRLESRALFQSPALGATDAPGRWRQLSFVRRQGPSGQAWATGDSQWLVEHDRDLDVVEPRTMPGMHSLCVVPVRSNGQVCAVFEYFSREIRPRDDAALQVLDSLNTQLMEVVERYRVGEDLKNAERTYRDLVEQSVQGIYQTTPDGRFLSVNPAFAHMAGYASSAELMTANLNAASFYVDSERRSEFLRAIEENGNTLGFEARIRRRDGSLMWIANYARAVRDDHGRIVTIEGSVEDITQRKEAEQMKSDFVSFVTHQLRTPLAGIKWLLELADGPELAAETASYVHDARTSADRLIALVNDLLGVARLENGKVIVRVEPFDLAALTDETVRELMPLVNEKHLQISLPSSDNIPLVAADRQLGKEVVGNLLSNAVRYTPEGGSIRIELHRGEGSVEWAVHDTGIGVPESAQHRLFEKFYRAENASMAHTEGTGLGLYIARLILERSGGRVWCESGKGAGSTFRFTLPAAA